MLEYFRPPYRPKVYFGEIDPDADLQLNSFGWVVRKDVIDELGMVTRCQLTEIDTQLNIVDLTPDYNQQYSRSLNKYLIYDHTRAEVRVIGIPQNRRYTTDYNQSLLLIALIHRGYSIVESTEERTVVINSIRPLKPKTP